MISFLVLPSQLFETNFLPGKKDYEYILWEHPHYFKGYKYNQKKLMLHKGSMQYYQDYLKKKGYQVKYVSFKESPKMKGGYQMFDPIDHIKLPKGMTKMLESPNFLLTKDQYAKYREKTDKFILYNFYMWGKKELDILPNVKSKDKKNRKRLPKNIKIPKLPPNCADAKYINAGVRYVKKHFNKNYGNTRDFIFPLTHTTAKKWFRDFLHKRFKNFGKYQDAISKDHNYLFHSILSTSINIGLLNPTDILEEVMKFKNKVPLNSLEGYVRQLFWREYQRYCYIYYNFKGNNYFGNKKKLTRGWYHGTLGIDPVDDCIKKGFDSGYLHHIERLMIVGNFMNLSGISPKEGFKWFMEFACDSYEWVMHQNVLDMVFFVSGGATIRRPYASSSNYILKMSNYKKGEWSEEWDNLYQNFKKRHKTKLWKYRYFFGGLKGV